MPQKEKKNKYDLFFIDVCFLRELAYGLTFGCGMGDLLKSMLFITQTHAVGVTNIVHGVYTLVVLFFSFFLPLSFTVRAFWRCTSALLYMCL